MTPGEFVAWMVLVAARPALLGKHGQWWEPYHEDALALWHQLGARRF